MYQSSAVYFVVSGAAITFYTPPFISVFNSAEAMGMDATGTYLYTADVSNKTNGKNDSNG